MEKAISLFQNYWCWYVLYLYLRSVFNVGVSQKFLFALRSCYENPAGTKSIHKPYYIVSTHLIIGCNKVGLVSVSGH